jgi:hypothetical protein
MNALLSALMQGVTVANPKAWQTGQITGTIIAGFLLSLLNVADSYGCPIHIDMQQANEIGAGVIAVFNIFMQAASTNHLGVIPAPKQDETK